MAKLQRQKLFLLGALGTCHLRQYTEFWTHLSLRDDFNVIFFGHKETLKEEDAKMPNSQNLPVAPTSSSYRFPPLPGAGH